MTETTIYTDGAYNPGTGAGCWAALIIQDGERRDISGDERTGTTSQRMELLAAIKALETLPEGSEATVHSASEYLTRSMTGQYKRRANQDLWQRLDELASTRNVSWVQEASTCELLPKATVAQAPKARRPDLGIARYEIPVTGLRQQLRDELAQRYGAKAAEAQKVEWALQTSEKGDQVRATMYLTGILLVQGRNSELWDKICSSIEELCSPLVEEIASRFKLVTKKELNSPQFAIGNIFDTNRQQTKAFISKAKLRKGMLDTLKGDLNFSRHFLLHSDASEAIHVETADEAKKHIDRLADSIKRSHEALVLNR